MTGRTGAEHNDHALVAAVRAGDDQAFEQLYGRYQRRITAYVNAMVRDHARAEDITQDVFVSALRRMRATEAPIAFKAWLFEIAKNACIDAFRRSRRANVVSIDAAEEAAGERVRLVSARPGPEAEVDTRQTLDDLRGAFGGLSDAHHQILVMREFEGRSYREIGERLEMSQASVESTLFRARKRLGEEYEELRSGRRCVRVASIIASGPEANVGARDARRMARHVSYCQPCRRLALASGFDIAPRPSVREKIAALLPLPGFLRRRVAGPEALLGHDGGAGFGRWSVAAQVACEPAMSGWAKAATAAVALAVAGAGAGFVSDATRSDAAHLGPRAATTAAAPARTSHPATTTTISAPASRQATPSAAGPKASGTGRRTSRDRPSRSTPPPSGSQSSSGGQAGSSTADRGSSSGASRSRTSSGTTSAGATGGAVKRTVTSAGDAAKRTVGGTTDAAGKTVSGTTDAAGKTVSGTADAAGKTVSGATGAAGKTVTNATGSVGNTVGSATGAAGNTVSTTTGAVGGAVGGPVGGAVGSAGGAVGGAVGSTGAAAGGTVGSAGAAAGGAAGSAGAAAGGAVGSAGSAAGGTVGTAGGAVGGAVGSAGSAVGGAVGGLTGGG